MKITVTESTFHDAFHHCNRAEQFSYEGRKALFSFLEEMEQGEDTELDVISLCCDWCEDDIDNILKDYRLDTFEDLEDNTTVIRLNNNRALFVQF